MKYELQEYKWLPGAIYPPELEWLKIHIDSCQVDMIIECGRQDGASALWYAKNYPNIEIYSIDLDDRPDIKANSDENLKNTTVKAITGNIFDVVPELIRNNPNKRICVIEDAVKSWPGLCLIASTFFYENVVLVAQHNLHIGHKTREYWKNSSQDAVFLEESNDPSIQNSLNQWIGEQDQSALNRPGDISSLGIIDLRKNRFFAIDYMLANRFSFRFWDPVAYRKSHGQDTLKFHTSFLRRSIVRKLIGQKR